MPVQSTKTALSGLSGGSVRVESLSNRRRGQAEPPQPNLGIRGSVGAAVRTTSLLGVVCEPEQDPLSAGSRASETVLTQAARASPILRWPSPVSFAQGCFSRSPSRRGASRFGWIVSTQLRASAAAQALSRSVSYWSAKLSALPLRSSHSANCRAASDAPLRFQQEPRHADDHTDQDRHASDGLRHDVACPNSTHRPTGSGTTPTALGRWGSCSIGHCVRGTSGT
jgi:hypothetical protein